MNVSGCGDNGIFWHPFDALWKMEQNWTWPERGLVNTARGGEEGEGRTNRRVFRGPVEVFVRWGRGQCTSYHKSDSRNEDGKGREKGEDSRRRTLN